jgi:sulfur relay (sulfurtransferase) complex TusBCD TusD component (DsrE family)
MKRRRFLQGLGGAALAAPFLSSLEPRKARAAGATGPQRLVIFYTNNGVLTNRWFPKVENGPIDATALAGTTLAGLSSFAPKLLFPRGLAMFPKGQINGYFDPHDQGMGSKLTAAPIDPAGSHWATSKSLDWVAASLVNPGTKSPLVLSVGSAFSNVKGIVSYQDAQTPFAPETNPKNVYNNLTGLFSGATTAADYHVLQGNSILDLVKGDLDGLKRQNMSMADQSKLSDWQSLLRQTEIKVTAACNATSATSLGITSTTVQSAAARDMATAFTKGGDMMIDLIALTMMCDANRVMILQWPGFVTFNWDGIMHTYDHHSLSHRNGSNAVGGTCVSGVIDMIGQIDNWYAGRYAKLVALIDSIKEGDNTMLDNSMVMWLPELADGNAHNNNNLPIVIAGSAGGYLKTGVSVNLDTKTLGTGNSEASCATGTDVSFNTGSNTGNVPLNKLHVTLLNALGRQVTGWQPVTSFGTMDTSDVTKGITNPGELTALKA